MCLGSLVVRALAMSLTASAVLACGASGTVRSAAAPTASTSTIPHPEPTPNATPRGRPSPGWVNYTSEKWGYS
ncbi:MAG: hypothetical protein M3082_15160, partial [Candidatus Dormibacteraeota bacterium]|nr:hypothetical protein [Candidatus Dormibacteraeota bacterium]